MGVPPRTERAVVRVSLGLDQVSTEFGDGVVATRVGEREYDGEKHADRYASNNSRSGRRGARGSGPAATPEAPPLDWSSTSGRGRADDRGEACGQFARP